MSWDWWSVSKSEGRKIARAENACKLEAKGLFDFNFREISRPGLMAGIFWNVGNFFTVYAVKEGGNSLLLPFLSLFDSFFFVCALKEMQSSFRKYNLPSLLYHACGNTFFSLVLPFGYMPLQGNRALR